MIRWLLCWFGHHRYEPVGVIFWDVIVLRRCDSCGYFRRVL